MHCSRPRSRESRRPRRGLATPGFLLPFLGLVFGCGEAVAPYHEPVATEIAGLYWALTIDHQAVTLSTVAPYDTLRLTATPRDADGGSLAASGTVTFRSSDEARVQVGADGLIRALKAGTNVKVIAELTAGNVRHADTVTVNVTTVAAPPTLASLSIHPVPPDSARWPADFAGVGSDGLEGLPPVVLQLALPVIFGKTLTIRAMDTSGHAISGLAVQITSSDETVAAYTSNLFGGPAVRPRRPGTTAFIATATAYGVTRTDTLPFTITMPGLAVLILQSPAATPGGTASVGVDPAEVTINRDGVAVWLNATGRPVDLVFDDSTDVAESPWQCGDDDPGGAGNVAAFGDATGNTASAANCRMRRFPVAGVYTYRSTTTGAAGRIVVTDGGQSDP